MDEVHESSSVGLRCCRPARRPAQAGRVSEAQGNNAPVAAAPVRYDTSTSAVPSAVPTAVPTAVPSDKTAAPKGITAHPRLAKFFRPLQLQPRRPPTEIHQAEEQLIRQAEETLSQK